MPLRQSPRVPLQTRSSSSESDQPHHRAPVDRSPKLGGDRRSPRGSALTDSTNQKKLGTRVADLETQLSHAQEELKKLKDQLASAEVAKREAQEELEKKTQKLIIIPDASAEKTLQEEENQNLPTSEIQQSSEKSSSKPDEFPEENTQETDVFEVPEAPMPAEPKHELTHVSEEEGSETKTENFPEPITELELEKPPLNDLVVENMNAEMNLLKKTLEEKDREVKVLREENDSLKEQVVAAGAEAASARAKEEQTALKLSQIAVELEASKSNEAQLSEKLEAVEGAKVELETEMKKLRVQTEQWRKAADAAAAVLAGGMEMNGRRMSERCGSMDKQLGGNGGGYTGFVGSPMADDLDDGFGSGRRKGSGIRMFGDLWKKKAQK